MKLTSGIILVVIVVLVSLSTAMAAIWVGGLHRNSEEHLAVYLELGLDQYMQQYPHRLYQLLEQHGLENIESFVASYQKEAIEAAADVELEMGAQIVVVTMSARKPLVESAGVLAHVDEQLQNGRSDEGLIHFDSEEKTYYLYNVFEPWDWVVLATAPERVVSDELGSIFLRTLITTAGIAFLASIVLSIVLRRFFVAPTIRIAAAARALPDGRGIELGETDRRDELGDLSRDIVAAGETIRKVQEKLYATNQNLERIVRERTAALDDSLARQKTFVREVHHRVKNNMNVVYALLNLHKRNAPTAQFADALSEIQRRITAMSLIHEQLYRGDGGNECLDVPQYLGSVIEQLRRSLPPKDPVIEIESHIESVALDTEIAMPCGLIINELVTNALKYAFVGRSSGRITVRLESTRHGHVSLTVADDGNGLPDEPSSGETPTSGVGEELIAALAIQLNGTISRSFGNGLSVCVTFPLSSEYSVSESAR